MEVPAFISYNQDLYLSFIYTEHCCCQSETCRWYQKCQCTESPGSDTWVMLSFCIKMRDQQIVFVSLMPSWQ